MAMNWLPDLCPATFVQAVRKPLSLAALFALLAPAASIGAPPDQTAERQRIQQERAQAESLFKDREQECLKGFVVTPCTDKAQRQRRQSLAELKRQENLLDEQLRRQRAADRDEALAEKTREREQAAQAAAGASAAEASAPAPQRAPREPRRPAATPEQAQAQAEQREAERSSKAAEATRRAQAQRGKVEAAARHKADVEKRNAEQARSEKPASPGLPIPPASAPHR